MQVFPLSDDERPAELSDYAKAVGQRVTVLMEERGMTDDELALVCGVTAQHIQHIKAGTPGYAHYKLRNLIAQALRVERVAIEGVPPPE